MKLKWYEPWLAVRGFECDKPERFYLIIDPRSGLVGGVMLCCWGLLIAIGVSLVKCHCK